jgi:hypothetical protein
MALGTRSTSLGANTPSTKIRDHTVHGAGMDVASHLINKGRAYLPTMGVEMCDTSEAFFLPSSTTRGSAGTEVAPGGYDTVDGAAVLVASANAIQALADEATVGRRGDDTPGSPLVTCTTGSTAALPFTIHG